MRRKTGYQHLGKTERGRASGEVAITTRHSGTRHYIRIAASSALLLQTSHRARCEKKTVEMGEEHLPRNEDSRGEE